MQKAVVSIRVRCKWLFLRLLRLINDIDIAVEYYNSVSNGLGFEFTDILDKYLQKNSQVTFRLLHPVR